MRHITNTGTRLLSALCRAGLLLLAGAPALANVADARSKGVLDFIGAIEANGYDDYYQGAAEPPPKPLTTMTVDEVLAWQAHIDARSNSEAAGKYQIVEDTLRELVDGGVVARDAPFNAATQDALALHLLERRGYDPARTDYANMGDAIAREWAALPVCTGLRAGRSYYDGLGGNSARTTCEAWLGVLAMSDDPVAVADAIALSRILAATTAAGTSDLDIFLDDLRLSFFDIPETLISIALSLLFSLSVIEWVLTTARQISDGDGLRVYITTLLQRITIAALFVFLITLSTYSDLVIASAEALLNVATTGASIDVVDLFDSLIAMVLELFGRSWWDIPDKIAAIVILLVGALLLAVIITAYIEVYIAFAAAIIALGFAGWTRTRHIAIRYLRTAASRTLSLFCALFCGAVMSRLLSFDLERETGSPLILAGSLIILTMLVTSVPDALEQAMTGRPAASTGSALRRLFTSLVFGGAKRGLHAIRGKT
ncbi:type IV secretion system protein [Ruegeria sp.]|uniref:type IV secretion system protein n=1 Tax=Ruegeria sp. TaxID=1879320 RepID=UPI003B0084A2